MLFFIFSLSRLSEVLEMQNCRSWYSVSPAPASGMRFWDDWATPRIFRFVHERTFAVLFIPRECFLFDWLVFFPVPWFRKLLDHGKSWLFTWWVLIFWFLSFPELFRGLPRILRGHASIYHFPRQHGWLKFKFKGPDFHELRHRTAVIRTTFVLRDILVEIKNLCTIWLSFLFQLLETDSNLFFSGKIFDLLLILIVSFVCGRLRLTANEASRNPRQVDIHANLSLKMLLFRTGNIWIDGAEKSSSRNRCI